MYLGVSEILLLALIVAGWMYLLHVFMKRAKIFRDYRSIRDCLVIGTIVWLVGSFKMDSSIQTIGTCIFLYGLALLLYNEYKRGQEIKS